MNHSRLFVLAGLAALSAAVACSDIVSPSRSQRYDWRLVINYDSGATTYTDTLSFHWPRASMPVKIWAEDRDGLPGYIDQAIQVWRNAFLYNEWDGVRVSDSSQADVIVLATQPPPTIRQAVRVHGMAESCEGATDVDTVATRFQLKVPIRSYVFVAVNGAPDLDDCLARVATHELGHTLGLFQHSTDSLDLMYTFPSRLFLTDRDLGAAYNAYHFPADMVPVTVK
jgi:predicted Zn-dependent protease